MQHTVALFVQNAEFSAINKAVHILNTNSKRFRAKWVPVTTAWRVLFADAGTASNMEGSCEHIEYTVADSRHGVVLQLGGWARC